MSCCEEELISVLQVYELQVNTSRSGSTVTINNTDTQATQATQVTQVTLPLLQPELVHSLRLRAVAYGVRPHAPAAQLKPHHPSDRERMGYLAEIARLRAVALPARRCLPQQLQVRCVYSV